MIYLNGNLGWENKIEWKLNQIIIINIFIGIVLLLLNIYKNI